ncbi:uncharacterized protein E0L32_001604 [Thyridium curvatum]|uniref:Uncharacterized protein n=1 Tax=Thyridium curvatum TaxID=1093900 RepID=A0A507AN30_9PEZI|nr:uncharacterized protein E0L32_001593 [Thyridium curvatum]XP_030990855.1 uncharacterized protein E0L32_001604 [Thyridium curvatum]TPX09133.1 hypothetical protein E0L32_001593 [Thyridium curvatum]TPX09144.1 hypothetical protein E0L32_001604 [Thyridium curvatum]
MDRPSPARIQACQPSPSSFPPPMMPSHHQQQPIQPSGPVLSHSQQPPQPPQPPMMSGAGGSAYASSPPPPGSLQQHQQHRLEEIHVTGPVLTQSPTQMVPRDRDLKAARSTAEFAVREYITLQRRRYGASTASVGGSDPALEDRIRRQAGMAGASLRAVRERVVGLAREAEAHRWRKWMLGGIL